MHPVAGLLLVALYLVLALVPLGVALSAPRPAGASFRLELSLALGFIGLGQLALQFGLIARFRRISRPLGIDLVMQWHRQVGIVAALIVIAHPLVLRVWQPASLGPLYPLAGDVAGTTGVVALLCILVLIALSVWRRQLGLGYETWRVTHALLGITAMLLAQVHVTRMGRYANASWKNIALWLWCLAFIALIAYLRLVKPVLLKRRAWHVADVRREAGETWSVVLQPDHHAGLTFSPGQFAWIKVGRSPWSVDEHPFSFSSSGEHPERIEFAISELGDFTGRIGSVRTGAPVYVDGPHGSFSCDFAPARRFVFVAGGIGIGPILSMVRTLADRGDARPITLVYACGSWERVAFRDELVKRSQRAGFTLVWVFEQAHAGWAGAVGYVTRDLMAPLVAADQGDTRYMICGPDAMMTAVERILDDLHVPAQRIDLERFNLV